MTHPEHSERLAGLSRPERSEGLARRVHLLLLTAIAAGLGLWLWRIYGFAPLRIVEPGR